jgi:hypothetical protein
LQGGEALGFLFRLGHDAGELVAEFGQAVEKASAAIMGAFRWIWRGSAHAQRKEPGTGGRSDAGLLWATWESRRCGYHGG